MTFEQMKKYSLCFLSDTLREVQQLAKNANRANLMNLIAPKNYL